MENEPELAILSAQFLKPAAAGCSPPLTPSTPLPESAPPVPPAAPAATPPNTTIVITPCAACRILRRRCVDKCVLAPYFPPTDPYKFTTAHRVFGAANIIKFLQELPESHRADAVSSMVYEANARIRDPVYGCAGAICQLQKQVSELQAQLAKTQAELVNVQCQNANLVALICMEMAKLQQQPANSSILQQQQFFADTSCFLDDSILSPDWEELWA